MNIFAIQLFTQDDKNTHRTSGVGSSSPYRKREGIPRYHTDGTAFLRTQFTLKNLNHTYQVFIPKVLHPSSPSDYRPVSLCNVGYKVIMELSANRLKTLLDGIISPSPGRQGIFKTISMKSTSTRLLESIS